MENTSKVLAGLLAGFFAILFVIATVLAFALYNIERSAFDADFYKQALTEEKVYQRLPELTAQGWLSLPRDPIMAFWRFSGNFRRRSGVDLCSNFCHLSS